MLKRTAARTAITLAATLAVTPLAAQSDGPPAGFGPGPVITEFGPIASLESYAPVPADATFAVAFDVAEAAEPGSINRTLVSAARFINMHAEAGVDPTNIRLTVVVHGGAALDLTRQEVYAARKGGAENANAAAITTLLENNVRIILCGQSATAHGISNEDLLPGVEMALSAMTAHALLQQEGFTLNPF